MNAISGIFKCHTQLFMYIYIYLRDCVERDRQSMSRHKTNSSEATATNFLNDDTICDLIATNQYKCATHEAHVNLFALACLNKHWRNKAKTLLQYAWNKSYLEEAEKLLEHMQPIETWTTKEYFSEYTHIVNSLRHLQVLKNENLQQQGIGALHVICYGKNYLHAKGIFDAGGLEVVIGAMVMHPTCARLNLDGCHMMTYMMKWRGQWSLRHSKTAVRVLVDMMTRFAGHADMHNTAVQCLTSLSTRPYQHPDEPADAEQMQIIMPQIYECRSAILELEGLKAALLRPPDIDVCLLLAIFAESEGNQTGRWQQVAGHDCIQKVVNGLRKNTVSMQMSIEDNMLPNLQYARASVTMLANLCHNAHNAGQVVAARCTPVFLDVLSALRRMNTHFSPAVDWFDLSCPDIVIPLLTTFASTVLSETRQNCEIVLPVVQELMHNTLDPKLEEAAYAVINSLAYTYPDIF